MTLSHSWNRFGLAGLGAWLASMTAAGPLAAGEPENPVTLVAEIKEDPAANVKLDWVIHMYAKGDSLFVISHRDGRINVFARDKASGDVKFLGFHDLAAQLSDPKHLL